MFEKLSHRRSVLAASHLLFSAVLLASVSAARADIIYNIVDYPANEADEFIPGTDTISGTIITDGVIGPITQSDIVGGILTITYPTGSASVTYIGGVEGDATCNGPLTATLTQLSLPSGSGFGIDGFSSVDNQPYVEYFHDFEYTGDNFIAGNVTYPYPSVVEIAAFSSGETLSTGAGSFGGPNPWIIANDGQAVPTPEPATLMLLVSALLGLAGAVYLRRCGAKA
jgi:hypothetical protein